MLVVQMHGLPGSGKSTVARALGEALPAVVLDKDVVKAAMLRSGIAEAEAAPAAYAVFWSLASNIGGQGYALVLDSPVFWPIVEENMRRVAQVLGARLRMVECVCDDRTELARRLATRPALESQPREAYAPRVLEGLYVPATERLTLDTRRPLADCVVEALAYVRGEEAA